MSALSQPKVGEVVRMLRHLQQTKQVGCAGCAGNGQIEKNLKVKGAHHSADHRIREETRFVWRVCHMTINLVGCVGENGQIGRDRK